jgi:L-ascorbate metabolism protein UlaG (beta-lactamase superfamily)
MDIQFYGANCVVLTTKQIRIVIDDNLQAVGGKSVAREGDVCLFTQAHPEPVTGAKMTIDLPGEYEVNGVNIHGLQSRSHIDTENDRNAVMYKIVSGDTKIVVTGHVYPKLSEAKLEDIGMIDVLVVPVGGNGYTLDPEGAAQIIKAIEPKVVIPTHYADAELSYEVPQKPLEEAVKLLSLDPKEAGKKFQFKPGEVSEATQLVVVEKS